MSHLKHRRQSAASDSRARTAHWHWIASRDNRRPAFVPIERHRFANHRASPNYSFKPNPLRGIACVPALRLHAIAATARVGLTQVLGCKKEGFVHRGIIRLGLALTILWLLAVVGTASFEYFSRNMVCAWDPTFLDGKDCQPFFWRWLPHNESLMFFLHRVRFVTVLLVPPISAWLVVGLFLWVAAGFRHPDKSNN